jgi:hypothetical protein
MEADALKTTAKGPVAVATGRKTLDTIFEMPEIERKPAIAFANQLRSARLAALSDAEAFDGIIHVVERLGSYLYKEELGKKGEGGSLFEYTEKLKALATGSGMAVDTPNLFRNLLTPFGTLYYLVRTARNDALHQGAFARHLTKHAIELAIILEEALSEHLDPIVSDFMVRNPVYAELWQPVGFVRQQMLANSYSYLPVDCGHGAWSIVSDVQIAMFLGAKRSGGERTKRLAKTLKEAQESEEPPLRLTQVEPVDENKSLADALELLKKEDAILLVWNPNQTARLVGVLTAFDLL